MRKYLILTALLYLFATSASAQVDTTNIFYRITNAAKEYKIDTTTPPNDNITKKIVELRSLKGGFNINEVITFKIEEDRQKKEKPESELDKLSTFFKTGNGQRWLDNAVIWIHRSHFTYKELKQLVKFYKTSAGQKMAADFPIIMIQSLQAAEFVMKMVNKG